MTEAGHKRAQVVKVYLRDAPKWARYVMAATFERMQRLPGREAQGPFWRGENTCSWGWVTQHHAVTKVHCSHAEEADGAPPKIYLVWMSRLMMLHTHARARAHTHTHTHPKREHERVYYLHDGGLQSLGRAGLASNQVRMC